MRARSLWQEEDQAGGHLGAPSQTQGKEEGEDTRASMQETRVQTHCFCSHLLISQTAQEESKHRGHKQERETSAHVLSGSAA